MIFFIKTRYKLIQKLSEHKRIGVVGRRRVMKSIDKELYGE